MIALTLLTAPATAPAANFYVDDSHPNNGNLNPCTASNAPCAGINAAIGKAAAGDTIHVGGGTYTEAVVLGGMKSLVRTNFSPVFTSGPAVLNHTTSPEPTIQVPFGDPAGKIEGLTIRGAHVALRLQAGAEVTGNQFDDPTIPTLTADVVVATSEAPMLVGNTFSDTDTSGEDRGVYILSSTGSAQVSENTFSGYHRAVDIFLGTATPIVSGNEVTGTHASGGSGTGIFVQGGPNPTITDNYLHSPASSAYGVWVRAGVNTTRATLRRNEIRGHTTGVYVLNANHPDPVSLDSDLVVGDGISEPLAIQGFDGPGAGNVVAQNVTLVNPNPAGTDVYLNDASLTLDSSILTTGGISVDAGSTTHQCTITSSRGNDDANVDPDSCVDGFQTTADPEFVAPNPNPLLGDYHLAETSPLIDAGSGAPALSPSSSIDIDGDPRVTDGDDDSTFVRDMGADETPGDVASGGGTATQAPVVAVQSPVVPRNDFSFGKLKRKKKKGIAFLIAFVPGPGEVGLAGRGIKNRGLAASARKAISTDGGRVKLKVVPTKKGKGKKIRTRLRTKGKAKVRVFVTYQPSGGNANTRKKRLRLIRRR